jgi:sigma-B regulation protein RsbU (phosphoserine phosphatase)
MSDTDKHSQAGHLQEDFDDFFENALSGHLVLDTKGKIIRGNARLASWIGCASGDFKGKRFSDLLTVGGKIYYETHLWPLLRMQGFFDEVALELSCNNGERLQVLTNGYERRDAEGVLQFVRLTVFKATDRRLYEQNLKQAKTIAENNLSDERALSALREQFIAVLGHDLRNPLAAITGGAALLANSAARMGELITNIMDFARARLGGGLGVQPAPTVLAPVIFQVVDEFRMAWPQRTIETQIDINIPIYCDADRVAQLVSNLVANALTHGASATPVYVQAFNEKGVFELNVRNSGTPIPASSIENLFHPFTREASRPSQQGLGLGLYIASEIAKAHGGTLEASSTASETRFTFRMKTME